MTKGEMGGKKRIWKYQFEGLPGRHIIRMVLGAKIVSVQPQHGRITIWAIVDRSFENVGIDGKPSCRTFHVVMTGEEFEECPGMKFLGTCQFINGFVVHVFELENAET